MPVRTAGSAAGVGLPSLACHSNTLGRTDTMLSVDNGSRSSRLLALGVACFGLLAVGSGLASWIAVQAVLRLVWPHRWLVGSVVVITEAAFYAYFKARHRQLAVVGGVPKGVDPQRAFDRFLAMATALPGAFDREKYSSTWFLNTPYEQIKAGNVEEFICYGFWYRTREQMEADGMGHLPLKCRQQMEAALSITFPPGYTPGLRFMDHLWDRLRAHYRPLGFYLFMELLGWLGQVAMKRLGFQQRQHGFLTYYIYTPATAYSPSASPCHSRSPSLGACSDTSSGSSKGRDTEGNAGSNSGKWLAGLWGGLPAVGQTNSPGNPAAAAADTARSGSPSMSRQLSHQGSLGTMNNVSSMYAAAAAAVVADAGGRANPLAGMMPSVRAAPILFLHGVGGLGIYLEMLKHVLALGHPVLVVEFKHVAMRLCSTIPSVDEITAGVVDILDQEGMDQVAVMAHSYGTFVASRLAQTHQQRLASLCLIDPVCFGMFMPHLLHNFIYRRPRLNITKPLVFLCDTVLYFASRELHIAATFCRNFHWTELNLWPQDVPSGSVIILSGNDDLCHAEDTRKMLGLNPHIKVTNNPNLFHGAFLLHPRTKANILAEVQHLLTSTGDAANRLLQHTLTVASPLLENTLSTLASVVPAARTTRGLVTHASLKLDATPAVSRLRTASSSVASFMSRRRAFGHLYPAEDAGKDAPIRPASAMPSAFGTPQAAGVAKPVAASKPHVAAAHGPTAADAAVPAAEEGWVKVSRPTSVDGGEQAAGSAAADQRHALEQDSLLGQLRLDDLSPLDQQQGIHGADAAVKAQDAGLRQRHAVQQGH